MPRFNPISKYSRNQPRLLHLNIIRDDRVDVSIKAKRLQLLSFTLLCNKINITVSFLQSRILTKFVCLFTSSLTFHILRLLLMKVAIIANFECQIHICH